MKRLKYLSLAALVAFAACDEGEQVVEPPPPAVGSIAGTVTAEGQGLQGVTVTISGPSSAQTTTGANGSYSFGSVQEGTYVVSIGSIPAGFVFTSTTSTVSINTDGQTATANFSGQVVRTASISGQVTADGDPVTGVGMTISGPEGDQTATTNSSGQYQVGGLRAGTYTVSITSNPDPDTYSFPNSSQGIQLAVGQAGTVNFAGDATRPGTITGAVVVDGSGMAGVEVALTGDGTASAETNASGEYSFTVDAGDYVVSITNPDPENLAFNSTSKSVSVGEGATAVANFTGRTIQPGTISGSVIIGGNARAGMTVTLGGDASETTETNAQGEYSFTVDAGDYTVSITNPDAERISFTATTKSVTVGEGEAKVVNFIGTLNPRGSISGQVASSGNPLGGITVALTGASTDQVVTGSDGSYAFTDLGPGTYTVTISGFDASAVSFDATSQTITLAEGEDAAANFLGTAASTAVVSIQGLTRTGTAGTSVSANNVNGTVDVTVQVDEGNDKVTQLTLMLGNTVVGTRTFNRSAQLDEPGERDQVLTIVFTVNTAAAPGGVPTFPNTGAPGAPQQFTASIQTVSGQAAIGQTGLAVTMNNTDTFTATAASTNVATDALGRPWMGNGSYTVTLTFINYSGRSLGTASVAYGQSANNTGAATSVGGLAPFAPGAGNLPGGNYSNLVTITGAGPTYTYFTAAAGTGPNTYQTDPSAGDEDIVLVTSATYANGDPVPMGFPGIDGVAGTADDGPLVLMRNQRWDDVAPAAGVLNLQGRPAGSTNACCQANWGFGAYNPAAGHAPGAETGVGLGTVTFQAGPLTAGFPGGGFGTSITTFAGLAATTTNTAYVMQASVPDRLGNTTFDVLAGAGVNPAATFGVDLTPPTGFAFAAAPASTPNMSIFNIANAPPAALAYNFAGTDNAAFGGNPIDLSVTRTTGAGLVGCSVGTGVPTGCAQIATGLANAPALLGDGLYTMTANLRDAGGNLAANTLTRTVYTDVTAPSVSNVVLPTGNPIPGGSQQTFSAVATDALSVGTVSFGLVFTGVGETLPFAAPQTFTTPFDGNFITSQPVTQTITFVPQLEVVQAGNGLAAANLAAAPAAQAQFLTRDAAGNPAVQNNNFAAGTVVAPTSVVNRVPGGSTFGMTTPAAAINLCNGDGSGACPAPPGNTSALTLTVTHTGPAGATPNPFAAVHFMFDDPNSGGQTRFIGTATNQGVSTNAGTGISTWTWTFTWNPAGEVLPGPVTVFAVGVEPNGNAVKTVENGNVTIIAGN